MLNLVILCVTDKEHSKCFYGIQLMQSFVCIYSISEKYRFVKRYLENKTQDIVSKTYYYSYKSVYIVLSFSSLLSLSSVLSLHEGIVFFVFASFRLAVCPVDFFPMGERRKRQKIWIENPFTFSGYSSYSPGLKVRWHIPLRVLCLLVLLCAVQNREKSTENQHPYSEQYKMTY